jgi:hypothetical protein
VLVITGCDLRHEVADWAWSKKLPPLSIGNSTLEQIPEDVLSGGLHDVHKSGKCGSELIDRPLSFIAGRVFADDGKVFLLHGPARESGHCYGQEIIEDLTTAPRLGRDAVEHCEQFFRFPMSELFFRHAGQVYQPPQ